VYEWVVRNFGPWFYRALARNMQEARIDDLKSEISYLKERLTVSENRTFELQESLLKRTGIKKEVITPINETREIKPIATRANWRDVRRKLEKDDRETYWRSKDAQVDAVVGRTISDGTSS
jgi:hypothetical protein